MMVTYDGDLRLVMASMQSLLRFEAFDRLPGMVAQATQQEKLIGASMQLQSHTIRRALKCLGNISNRS